MLISSHDGFCSALLKCGRRVQRLRALGWAHAGGTPAAEIDVRLLRPRALSIDHSGGDGGRRFKSDGWLVVCVQYSSYCIALEGIVCFGLQTHTQILIRSKVNTVHQHPAQPDILFLLPIYTRSSRLPDSPSVGAACLSVRPLVVLGHFT